MISPSENFVAFFTKQVYSGALTAKVKEQFTPIVKRSLNLLVSDAINERLKSALNQEKEIEVAEAAKQEETGQESASSIVTTDEELEGFYIVKSLLRQNIDSKRIGYRDAQSYFAILLDDNNRKTICRLYLNTSKKYLVVLDDAKKEVKYEIQTLDEIYKYSKELLSAVARLEKAKI